LLFVFFVLARDLRLSGDLEGRSRQVDKGEEASWAQQSCVDSQRVRGDQWQELAAMAEADGGKGSSATTEMVRRQPRGIKGETGGNKETGGVLVERLKG
jgi:hypothetical protein